QPLDAMVDAMTVGDTYLVRLFPEEINDVDCAALFMHPENRAKPTLAVDRFGLQSQLHSVSARLNAEIWNVRLFWAAADSLLKTLQGASDFVPTGSGDAVGARSLIVDPTRLDGIFDVPWKIPGRILFCHLERFVHVRTAPR